LSGNCAGMDSVIELLVKSGYDVNVQRPDGITALMIACRMVCNHAVYLLVDVTVVTLNGTLLNHCIWWFKS